jgi:hypothetical protein
MASVMSHQRDANPIRQLAIDEVVGESFQVRPMKPGLRKWNLPGLAAATAITRRNPALKSSPSLCDTAS